MDGVEIKVKILETEGEFKGQYSDYLFRLRVDKNVPVFRSGRLNGLVRL